MAAPFAAVAAAISLSAKMASSFGTKPAGKKSARAATRRECAMAKPPTKAAAKKSRMSRKPTAKAVKKTDKATKVGCPIKSDSSKKSRNGTPKGKGTRVGRNGNGRI